MILSGDIGGTRTRLALCAADGRSFELRGMETYASRDHSDLLAILEAFRRAHPGPLEAACFGVAGPVRDGRAVITNLPWVVDAAATAAALGIGRVSLINDLEAGAYGIDCLEPADLLTLNPGRPHPEGTAALIAAGTGLGEAGLGRWGGRPRAIASEGGHCDFAPRTPIESRLLDDLGRHHGHVSYERVLSGPGLENIFRFLLNDRGTAAPAWLTATGGGDLAAAITSAAASGRCETSRDAVDLFVGIYGAEAGNLGLKMHATGGVYVGGGIAPRILDRLRGPLFLEAFLEKGRMRSLMERMPLHVILREDAMLLGAARAATLL